jgi:hypothetical protein
LPSAVDVAPADSCLRLTIALRELLRRTYEMLGDINSVSIDSHILKVMGSGSDLWDVPQSRSLTRTAGSLSFFVVACHFFFGAARGVPYSGCREQDR